MLASPYETKPRIAWRQKYSQQLMRLTLAVIFTWSGALLIRQTGSFLPPLGWWEVAIGICFLWRPLTRSALLLLYLLLPGTMLPLLLLPEVCFASFPFEPTLVGQYIVNNLFLVSAALVIGNKIRDLCRSGGRGWEGARLSGGGLILPAQHAEGKRDYTLGPYGWMVGPRKGEN